MQGAGDNAIRVRDTVATRRNHRKLVAADGQWVRNGARWVVTGAGADGSLTAHRLDDPDATITLPASYTASHVHLGYATTQTRVQSLTVDAALCAVTVASRRPQLYVGLTRGRAENHLIVVTDQPQYDEDTPPDHLPTDHIITTIMRRGAAHPLTVPAGTRRASPDVAAAHVDRVAATPHSVPLPDLDELAIRRTLSTPAATGGEGIEAQVGSAIGAWLDEQHAAEVLSDTAEREQADAFVEALERGEDVEALYAPPVVDPDEWPPLDDIAPDIAPPAAPTRGPLTAPTVLPEPDGLEAARGSAVAAWGADHFEPFLALADQWVGQPGPSPLDDPGPLVDLAVRYQTARWVEDRRAAAHTVALMSAVADPTLRAMLAPLVRHPLTATERQWAADVVAADRCYWYRAVADWLDDGASATRLSAVWHAATRRTAPVLVGAADPPARWTAPTPWAAAAHQRPDTTRLPAGLPAVALPAAPPPERAESDAHAPSRRVLRRSADWYHHQLVRSPAAEEARRYLIDRGITPDDWRKWNLGWAPAKWRGLCAAIRDDEAAVEAGVANTSKGRVYDVLRGRLVFPIRDLAGDVIGFAGRKLPGDDPKKPKYLNTRTTPLYRKTDTLYGIAEAAEGIRSSGSAGVVEGYTDAIAAHKAGLTNVVATGGTAFTDSHLTRILAAGAHHLVAAFDGDQAGHDAQRRVVDQAHRTGVPTTAVSFPAGEDPASLDTDALVEHWWAGLPQPWTHINQHLSGDDIHSRIRGHRALAATYADGDPILAAVASHQALVHTLGATPQTIAAWRRSTTPAQSREQADTSRAGLSL